MTQLEEASVTPEFKKDFHRLYPNAYGDKEARKGFTSLLKTVIEQGNLDVFKYMIYSLNELGTHAAISPAEQMVDFCKWLPETKKEEYKVVLAELIEPENLPEFSGKPFEETEYEERKKRSIVNDIFFALLYLTAEKVDSRKAITASAMKFLESDKAEVELQRSRPDLAQYVAVNLLINNQVNRDMQPLWEAIFYKREVDAESKAQKRILKQPFHMGFHGLMNMPTLEGETDTIPLDVAPGAIKSYIEIIDQQGGDLKKWFAFSIGNYIGNKNSGELRELLQALEFTTWPEWAREQVNEFLGA